MSVATHWSTQASPRAVTEKEFSSYVYRSMQIDYCITGLICRWVSVHAYSKHKLCLLSLQRSRFQASFKVIPFSYGSDVLAKFACCRTKVRDLDFKIRSFNIHAWCIEAYPVEICFALPVVGRNVRFCTEPIEVDITSSIMTVHKWC
jgi:hypothetical protein